MRSKQRNVGTTQSRSSEGSSATNAKRRGFLLALGVGGAGAAALAARSITGVSPTAETTDPAATTGEGYRLTDHVKRYYQTAKT
jgi:hypothetical protein